MKLEECMEILQKHKDKIFVAQGFNEYKEKSEIRVENCKSCGRVMINRNHQVTVNIITHYLSLDFKELFDWSTVKKDTKTISGFGNRRYFAKYENGLVHLYPDGKTSWSNTIDNLVKLKPEDVKIVDE
jgi:hypothetical protein